MISETTFLDRFGKVSQVEIGIVQQLCNDVSRKDIAAELGIDKRNLDARIDSLRKKVNINSVAGMVALFFRNKLVE